MKTVLLACRIMEQELCGLLQKHQLDYPIVWFPSKLHDRPQELNRQLAQALEAVSADRVLMTFGQCGGCTDGLVVPVQELIIPRVDDCITLLLGSFRRRQELNSRLKAYYMTDGWVDKQDGGASGFDHIFARYGQARGQQVIDAMYRNYCSLCMIDTGVCDMAQLTLRCQPIARLTHTTLTSTQGTTAWLEQLLTGPWPEDRFVIRRKGERLQTPDFYPEQGSSLDTKQ